jgi:FixJ family two-component response regulator
VLARRSQSGAQLVSIVDDDASVRRSICRLIRSLGMEAEAFASAEEFLNSGRATQSDCVILDVRMPGIDGLELQRRLIEIDPHIPIVFLTAYASEEEERRARQAGAIEWLRKPVAKDALLRVLRGLPGNSSIGGGSEHDH